MGAGYRHKQVGWLLRSLVVAPAPFLRLLGPALHQPRVTLTVAPTIVLLAAVALFFTSLTIEIDDTELRWFFGPGVWRNRIALPEIASATPVKNPWWYGLGIHRTARGWLYNVAGLDAVEIVQTDGKIFRIGTDEPEALARALAPGGQTG